MLSRLKQFFDYSLPVKDCRLAEANTEYYLRGYSFPVVFVGIKTIPSASVDIYSDIRFCFLMSKEDFRQYLVYHGFSDRDEKYGYCYIKLPGDT